MARGSIFRERGAFASGGRLESHIEVVNNAALFKHLSLGELRFFLLHLGRETGAGGRGRTYEGPQGGKGREEAVTEGGEREKEKHSEGIKAGKSEDEDGRVDGGDEAPPAACDAADLPGGERAIQSSLAAATCERLCACIPYGG